jgi:hypothetical protein
VAGAWGNTPDTPRSALGHQPASALASVGLFSADASAGGATPAAAVPQGGTGQGGLVAVREDDLRALARRWAVRRLHPAQDGLTSEEVADSVFTELARSSA